MASDALLAAKLCVASAERAEASATQQVQMAEEMLAAAKSQLAAAKSQLTSRQTDVDEAKKHLKNMEERFKVINIDSDSDEDDDGKSKEGKGDSPHKRGTDNIENQNQNNGQQRDGRQRRVFGSTGATDNNAREVLQSTTGNVARSFQIFARVANHKTYTLDVTSLDTIADVKAKIYEKSRVTPERQFRLKYNCKTLVDSETLSSYNIKNETTLHLSRWN